MTEPGLAAPGTAARLAAGAVHLYTASGVVIAFLAAMEIFATEVDVRKVFLWLLLAVLIDATDGPLARKFQVKSVMPEIDGRKIDDIVDFLTFTFLPLLLVARMGWVREPELLFLGPALLASVLGFANVSAKIESGGFFLGFPSYWNVIAFYLGISAAAGYQGLNGAIVLLFAVLTIVPLGFIYPNLAPRRWKLPILAGAALWVMLVLMMLPNYPLVPRWMLLASLLYGVFYVAVSFYEYARFRRRKAAA